MKQIYLINTYCYTTFWINPKFGAVHIALVL